MAPLWHLSPAGFRGDPARAPRGLDPVRFEVARFEQLPGRDPRGLLGLSVRMPFELPRQARPTLVVERDSVALLHSPRLASSARVPASDGGDWLWRGIFGVAPELCSEERSLFSLRLYEDFSIALPPPAGVLRPPKPAERHGTAGVWPYAIRRGLLLLVVTCQLCVTPGISSGALAAEDPGPVTTVEPAPEQPSGPAAETPGEPTSGPPAEAPSEPTPEPRPGQPGEPSHETQPAPRADAAGEQASGGAVGSGGGARPESTRSADGIVVKLSGSQASSGTGTRGSRRGRHHGLGAGPRRGRSSHHAAGEASPAGAAGTAPAPDFSEVPPVLLRLPPGLEGLGEDNPPGYLIPIYEQAGRRYGVPWRVLAAINLIETDYGHNLSVSSAGAVGWMQFMPETWSRWALDADHDGKRNPYSPLDAIFTAARYLQASGASRNLPAAIYAYNHAAWYVTEVLLHAHRLEHSLTSTGSERGYALPLDAPYILGRTDDGVDIETAPDGALVYSITPGIVSAVASDPAGFGPNYPVIEASSGALAGQYIYYGHVARALVRPGERVSAGEPVAVMGHTGDAASLGHGHIEIGFADAGGDPLSHHGAEAWTPAGEAMRSFLVTLSDALRAHNARSKPPLQLIRAASLQLMRAAPGLKRASEHAPDAGTR
jgi:murein DD-endopeptidase MepM/ murein hydrolase activator NlpD